MSFLFPAPLFPALGAAIAVAGADKLSGDKRYRRLFRHLGLSRDQMQTAAIAEIAGGLLMAPRATRRLGCAIVTTTSVVMLSRELQAGDNDLALARGLVLLAGLAALIAPSKL
jgi:hypothetical protein